MVGFLLVLAVLAMAFVAASPRLKISMIFVGWWLVCLLFTPAIGAPVLAAFFTANTLIAWAIIRRA